MSEVKIARKRGLFLIAEEINCIVQARWVIIGWWIAFPEGRAIVEQAIPLGCYGQDSSENRLEVSVLSVLSRCDPEHVSDYRGGLLRQGADYRRALK